MVGAPCHPLAKWLARKLSVVEDTLCEFSIKDSFQFVENMHKIKLNSGNCFLASLDVTSLFTNVPVKRCIDFVCETIVEYGLNFGKPIDLFKRLLQLCEVDVQFMFMEKFFRQIDGVASLVHSG